jgi:hypothetical protein
MQVGPVQRELELTHLDRTPVAHDCLRRSQGLRSVELLDGDEADGLWHVSTQALATDNGRRENPGDPQARS